MKIYCFRCKGTTKNVNTQIFSQKNTFFLRKNAYSAISPFKVAADALFIRTFTSSPI